MAFNFGDVGHAADRESEEFPIQRLRYRLADGRFPDTGWPYQGDNFTLRRASQLPDRNELEYAFFDVLQAVMVAIENVSGVRDVQLFFADDAPRERREPFQIVSGDVKLRARWF